MEGHATGQCTHFQQLIPGFSLCYRWNFGLGVSISHPDRVIFNDIGVTKGELAEYYAAAAPWILKDITGHPVSLLRCPEGAAGDCFYQRNPGMEPQAGRGKPSDGNIRASNRTNILYIEKMKKD